MMPTVQYCVVLHSYLLGSHEDASDHAISAKMNTHEKWTWTLTPKILPRPKVPDTMFLRYLGRAHTSRTVRLMVRRG